MALFFSFPGGLPDRLLQV